MDPQLAKPILSHKFGIAIEGGKMPVLTGLIVGDKLDTSRIANAQKMRDNKFKENKADIYGDSETGDANRAEPPRLLMDQLSLESIRFPGFFFLGLGQFKIFLLFLRHWAIECQISYSPLVSDQIVISEK